ncbi:MAG: thioesterase domain-containing protein, partial [Candidatus Tectomicrobia bacterium]|nr:thioesterase domain-containing protein [Candidatus Tectomicrobia bacterium]
AVISSHPGVSEVCVFSTPHSTLGEEIAAAIVASPGKTVSEAEIRAHARGRLTGFKVPRLVFVLPSLPKSATNKVQRREVTKICHELLRTREDASDCISHPWSAIEREIAELWADVLKIPVAKISSGDDFFLIGGDSLKAFELFILIERRYRVRLGLGHIFDEAATVQGMALLVGKAREGRLESVSMRAGLVFIKGQGDRPPLFAIPGSGGNPLGFVHLGRLLDERQPLIGIESRGMDGSVEPLDRMEAIAADNIARIKSVQPSGPYFLTGSCYGGRVAYEMARQLQAAGETIGLLLMLGPSAPFCNADGRPRGLPRRRARLTRFILYRIAVHFTTVAKLRGAERKAYLLGRLRTLRRMRRDSSWMARSPVYDANREAGRRYIPGPFAGPTKLCFTRGRPGKGPGDYRFDWLQLVPQAGTPTFIAGKYDGYIIDPPPVHELAPHVNRWLAEAQEATTQAEATALIASRQT